MSLSRNLALACFIDSVLLEVTSVFPGSLFSDDRDGEDLSPVWSWLDDDGFCITVFSVSSDFVTLLLDEMIFFASIHSPGSVRFGGSFSSSMIDFVFITLPLLEFEDCVDSIVSSCRSGVVSQMLPSKLLPASSTGDLAIS